MIEEGVAALLTAAPGVTAIAGDRVYPLVIPQEIYTEASRKPCLVYQRIATEITGTFCQTDTLRGMSLQVDAYARTYGAARALAAAAKAALLGFTGAASGVAVSRVTLAAEFDGLDEEPGLYRRSLTFSIWYAEA